MKAREEAPMQPMSRPEEALNNLMESVLLAFRFDPRRRTFTLVSDYPFRSPGSRREFAGFVLEDVDFERLAGDNEYDQAYQDSFQAQGPGGLVCQRIRQPTDRTVVRAELRRRRCCLRERARLREGIDGGAGGPDGMGVPRLADPRGVRLLPAVPRPHRRGLRGLLTFALSDEWDVRYVRPAHVWSSPYRGSSMKGHQ